MNHEDDFDRGLVNRRAVLGDAWVDRATGNANALNADFQSLITQWAWHDVWGRPGLERETRRLLVLATTLALGRWEEFELHCGAAIRGGVPLERIRETLIQGAIYAGVPAANTAFKIAVELCRKEGVELEPAPLVAPQRVQRHRSFSAPQLQIALQGAGDGVPVVLSHALGVDHRMWDGLAAELGKRHPVLRHDHRGHGGSAVPPGPYRIDELVDDAARVIREWGRGPVVFVGLSMGGMVGQGLGVKHPELLRGLVLANTMARVPPEAKPVWDERIAAVEAQGMAAVADATLERWLTAPFRAAHPQVVASIRETLLRCDPRGYVGCCHAIAGLDLLDSLPAIRCPTLVVTGAQDAGASPAVAQAIAERIPGAQLDVFEDCAHLSVVEQPERFASEVRAFVSSLG